MNKRQLDQIDQKKSDFLDDLKAVYHKHSMIVCGEPTSTWKIRPVLVIIATRATIDVEMAELRGAEMCTQDEFKRPGGLL